jgi:tetratricopeptide (TPR) repeat protein
MTSARQTRGSPADLTALVALAQREHHAGRLDEAATAYRKILAIRPDVAEVRNDLGIILAQAGKLDLAAAQFDKAIALKPDLPEAHFNLGNVLKDRGRLSEAAARFEQALALRPNYAEAHNNLGIVSRDQGKLDQAKAHYEHAIALRPDYAEAHNNLGNILWKQDKLDEAAARFEYAIALRPGYAEAHNNLGNVLLQQDKLEQAVARFEHAIALWPDYTEAHSNLGSALWKQGKLDEAVTRFEQALALRPDYVEAHNNLGNVFAQQDKLDQAVARFQHAIALRPDFADAHCNLAKVLLTQYQVDQATARYEQALALRPDYADAQHGLAACYLLEGNYERGWPAYEGRLRMPGIFSPPSIPRWTGQPLAGRRILLLTEQGLGDTIQFVRYARLLKERGARVVLAAQPALGGLLASHPDVDELVLLGSAVEVPRCDYYLPLLSAPCELRTDASTIPCQVPYLWADPKLTDQWRQELAAVDGFKIGIIWQGSRTYSVDRWRSIPLARFAPLAALPGVRLISLQKGFGSEQVATVDFPVLDLSSRLDETAGPFMDTAAVIRNLDLVVAPNTGIAHLAGALGAPVWVALHFAPDWRWLRDRDDSPWYPTLRLFRQKALGQWPEVFERIAAAVQARSSETAQSVS